MYLASSTCVNRFWIEVTVLLCRNRAFGSVVLSKLNGRCLDFG